MECPFPNLKPNEAKTALLVNVLGRWRRRVCVVDFDPILGAQQRSHELNIAFRQKPLQPYIRNGKRGKDFEPRRFACDLFREHKEPVVVENRQIFVRQRSSVVHLSEVSHDFIRDIAYLRAEDCDIAAGPLRPERKFTPNWKVILR